MTEQGRKIAAGLVLLILALPSGLCSGVFAVGGIANSFDRDPVANVAGTVMLVGAAIGGVFCLLMILLWRRLRRDSTDTPRPGASP